MRIVIKVNKQIIKEVIDNLVYQHAENILIADSDIVAEYYVTYGYDDELTPMKPRDPNSSGCGR